MFPRDSARRSLWGVRFGGIAFAAASTYMFFFGLGGGHNHRQLWLVGLDGRTALPSAPDDAPAPVTAAAGAFSFAFDRTGGVDHDLVVTADGGNEVVARAVTESSDSQSGTPLFLAPGAYTIFCVLPGHSADGMTYRVMIN